MTDKRLLGLLHRRPDRGTRAPSGQAGASRGGTPQTSTSQSSTSQSRSRAAVLGATLVAAVVCVSAAAGVRTHSDAAVRKDVTPAPTGVAPSGDVLGRTADLPLITGPFLPVGDESTTTYSPASIGTLQQSLLTAPAGDVGISALAADGIPSVALAAYQRSAAQVDVTIPGCNLSWTLLAGIGRVESDHGRFAGAQLQTDGVSTIPIIGIALDGHGTALIRDTDHGLLDGDTVYDRAVGPMQFIPSTWASYGADGDGDGVKNPFDIDDAALAAANYLCVAGGDLSTRDGQIRAVLAYNHSGAYVSEVLALAAFYAGGTTIVPVTVPPSALPTSGEPTTTLPPVDPVPSTGPPTRGPTRSAPATTTRSSSAGSSSAASSSAAPSQSSQSASSVSSASVPASSSTPPRSSAAPSTSSTRHTSSAAQSSSAASSGAASTSASTCVTAPGSSTASTASNSTDAAASGTDTGAGQSTGATSSGASTTTGAGCDPATTSGSGPTPSVSSTGQQGGVALLSLVILVMGAAMRRRFATSGKHDRAHG